MDFYKNLTSDSTFSGGDRCNLLAFGVEAILLPVSTSFVFFILLTAEPLGLFCTLIQLRVKL